MTRSAEESAGKSPREFRRRKEVQVKRSTTSLDLGTKRTRSPLEGRSFLGLREMGIREVQPHRLSEGSRRSAKR